MNNMCTLRDRMGACHNALPLCFFAVNKFCRKISDMGTEEVSTMCQVLEQSKTLVRLIFALEGPLFETSNSVLSPR